jgi:hypothetical protein
MSSASTAAAATAPSILVVLDNLPTLPQETNRRPELVDRFSRQVLRWIGERDSRDLAKIYMPLTPVGASYGLVMRLGSVLVKRTGRTGPLIDRAAGTLSYAVILMLKLGL